MTSHRRYDTYDDAAHDLFHRMAYLGINFPAIGLFDVKERHLLTLVLFSGSEITSTRGATAHL